MGRTKEFDREQVLRKAMIVFGKKDMKSQAYRIYWNPWS